MRFFAGMGGVVTIFRGRARYIATMNKILHSLLIAAAACAGMSSCIEDGFTTSPSDAPLASVDTLHLGTVFTDEGTPTHRFTLRNNSSKSVNLTDIRISGDHSGCFRMNVDGFSGTEFSDVEIRAKDSIYVFVEATLPANGADVPVTVRAKFDYTACGVTRTVVLDAQGRDAVRLRGRVLEGRTTFVAGRPYIVYDSLLVAPGAELRLEPGTELYFHDDAWLEVQGTLTSRGTPDRPVHMAGDRTGNVVADISFDIMSRQWAGLYFTSTSRDNVLEHTDVRNTWDGVAVVGSPAAGLRPQLRLVNSTLHNSAGYVLQAVHADTEAYGCQFSEGGEGLVRLHGGSHVLNHCTLANYYLFAAIGGPALQLGHTSEADSDDTGAPYTSATVSNSIIYGLGTDVNLTDLAGTAVSFDHCLLKSDGTDDEEFHSCLWDTDPLYRNDRASYVFDYRLQPESPARGAGLQELTRPEARTDMHGRERGQQPDLGAFVYAEP